MIVAAKSSPVLLVDSDKVGLVPLSLRALEVSQDGAASLNSKYEGAMLLYDDGSVRKIEKVVRLGLYGDSIGRKLLSALTSVFSIQVELSDAETMPLSEFKSLIIELTRKDARLEEPALPHSKSIEETIGSIRASESFTSVFDAIEMPGDEDCLDAL